MKMEITKHNYERVMGQLNDIAAGCDFVAGNTGFHGVTSIEGELTHICDGEPDPEVGYDGGGEDHIYIRFNFENGGQASVSFCPDSEHCEVTEERDDLWIFWIKPIPEYVAQEKELLDNELREYEEYMSKGDD